MYRLFTTDINLEPPAETIYGYCDHCGGELYSEENIEDGYRLCDDCRNFARTNRAVVEYIRAYPERFLDYLRDCETSDIDFVLETLNDYREDAGRDFDDWIAS